jgi:hypothetical protein
MKSAAEPETAVPQASRWCTKMNWAFIIFDARLL